MVQVLPQLQQPPSMGATMGNAIGQGFLQGATASLNQRIQDQQEQKKLKLQEAYNTKTNESLAEAFGYPELGKRLGSAPPELTSKLLTTLYENGVEQKSILDQIKMATGGNISVNNQPNPVPDNQPIQQNNPQQGGIGQNIGFQVPSQTSSLNQQQILGNASQQTPQTIPIQQPSQGPLPSTYRQDIDQANKDLYEAINRPGANNKSRQAALSAFNTRMNLIEKQNTSRLAQDKQSYKEKQDIITRAEKYTDPIKKEITAIKSSIEKRKSDFALQKDAIKRGNFGPGSLDHLLSLIGLDASVSKEASQFKGAIKGNVVDTLNTVTGQKNMFLERMMVGAAGELGATPQGNLILADGIGNKIAIDEMKINNWDKIEDRYLNDPEYGYVPAKGIREWEDKNRQDSRILAKDLMKTIQEDREYGMTTQELMKLDKNAEPTPLTEKRAEAIVQRSVSSLKKARGREPSKNEVLKYSQQLIKDYNYIMPEE